MTTDPKGLHLETLAIGYGYDPAQHQGSAKPPLFLTSTFVYPTAQIAKDAHRVFFNGPVDGEPAGAYIYSRLNHPNLDMVEKRLAVLDGAEDCAAFSSGMAALSTTLMTLLRPGDSMVYSRPIYSGTDGLMNGHLTDYGIKPFGMTDAVDRANVQAAVDLALKAGPLTVMMIESPANPTAATADIAMIRAIADEVGTKTGLRPLVVVDNTFLGPLLQSPLKHGADLTMTSLTKYCGGHSDLLAGCVSGDGALVRRLKQRRTTFGCHLDPHTSWLMLRSIETLSLRTERSCSNAAAIARFLADHPKVRAVTYLGFLPEGSPARAVYVRQCKGAGSTFSFKIKGGEAEAFRMLDKVRLAKMAVSLGGAETLICHSATTTHYAVPQVQREEVGIDDGTIRISVGLEHIDDLIADLSQALEAV
jgi:cystathionine gamma-synthase/methionine-gamma-lyase